MTSTGRRFIAAGVEAQNALARLSSVAAELGLERTVINCDEMTERIEGLLEAVENGEQEEILWTTTPLSYTL
jgi:hypothetical protein